MARSKNQARKSKKKDNSNNEAYDIIIKENSLFEKYYRQLNIVEESEWDLFMNILKKPLPVTFRITSYKSYAKEILRILKEKHFKYLDEITQEDDGKKVLAAATNKESSLLQSKNDCENDDDLYKCLDWYPNQLAWQVNLSRQDIRKNLHFQEFKQFLIHQTENGNVSRQEAVSMIPPLLLDIQPHHKVLDLCAAPGSKTAQLIEFLHQDESNPTPSGFVIANDLENKRCYMLMHQLKRLESSNFMIINHDAASLPNFRNNVYNDDEKSENILFDRILSDVPCSGDGTFRKNIDIWKKWNFTHACNLHGIQFRIAKRAVELLQYNGIMVYSTCSFNPIENEAVVYNLLNRFKGQLELVDVRNKLNHLKTSKGLLKWNLISKSGDIFENAKQVEKTELENLMRPYMFPPDLDLAKEMNLDKCLRILPHHQNTGGFFIAVIRKLPKKPIIDLDAAYLNKGNYSDNLKNDLEKEMNTQNGPPERSAAMKAPPAKRLKHVYEENPFKFIEGNAQLDDWEKIKEFFEINQDFPTSQMMTRNKNGENVRNVYFVSKEIRELAINNGDRFKFINMGVPLFNRADMKDLSNVELRVCQESLDIALKYFNRRIVKINQKSEIIKLLTKSMSNLNELSSDLQEEIRIQSKGVSGCLILTWDRSNTKINQSETNLPITFTAWVGKTFLRPLLNINARVFFLTLCEVDQFTITEACNKIKQDDKLNSQRSNIKTEQKL